MAHLSPTRRLLTKVGELKLADLGVAGLLIGGTSACQIGTPQVVGDNGVDACLHGPASQGANREVQQRERCWCVPCLLPGLPPCRGLGWLWLEAGKPA